MRSILLLCLLFTGQALADQEKTNQSANHSANQQKVEVPSISYEKTFRVGDWELDYVCKGTGSPVTFLEPPSGDPSESTFYNVFDAFAKTNKTCIYTRLGNGDDPRGEGLNLTGWDYVKQLEALVEIEAKDQPIIMVGYSFGRFVSHLFASKYPEKVKGMLLLDPPHEDWIQTMKREMDPEDWKRIQWILDWFLAAKGHNVWDTQFEVEKAKIRADLPIIIITRGLDQQKIRQAEISEKAFRQFNDIHFDHQKELENLTSNTKRIIAHKSEHLLLNFEPEVAIEAFRELNEKIKQSDQ